LGELVTRYLQAVEGVKRSVSRDAYSSMRLVGYFSGSRELQTVKRSDVRAYREYRKVQGVSAGTVNREVSLLSSMINYARREWDWDIANPAERQRLREPEGRKRFLTRVQAIGIVEAARKQKRAPYLADLITVAMNTGCRRGELLRLEVGRVDLKANTLQLREQDTKSGKARTVPLNQEARAALLRRFGYRAEHCPDTPWVFCQKSGKRMESVDSSWRRVCKTVGLDDFHFHDLRHTCGSWLVQAGVPEAHVMGVLGHSTIRMTERYAHLAPENVRAAVDKLDAWTQSGHTDEKDRMKQAGGA
jgi:integrase